MGDIKIAAIRFKGYFGVLGGKIAGVVGRRRGVEVSAVSEYCFCCWMKSTLLPSWRRSRVHCSVVVVN